MDVASSSGSALSTSHAITRLPYESPRLSVLGDVCSLTETGSMMEWESPLNLCWLNNMTGNTCMG